MYPMNEESKVATCSRIAKDCAKKIASSHRVKSEKVVSDDLIKHPPCAALAQMYERT